MFLCSNCPYNASLHARNYFNSTNCLCFAENKHFICIYCTYLKLTLIKNVLKVCIAGENLEKCSFDGQNEKINLHVGNSNYGDFFNNLDSD